MELITKPLVSPVHRPDPPVEISVDRLTLARRRWRGVAANGREFGFDLEHPLDHGALVHDDGVDLYRIAQRSEPVLTVALHAAAEAARLGWLLGNLHFRIAVEGDTVQVPDDPAVRQMLEREHIHYHVASAVFAPLSGGHSHGHH